MLAALASLAAGGTLAAGKGAALRRMLVPALTLGLLALAINVAAAALSTRGPLGGVGTWTEGLRVGAWTAARLAVTALALGGLAATTSAGRRARRTRRRAAAAARQERGRARRPGHARARLGPLVAAEGRRLLRAVALRADRAPGLWAAPAVAVPLVLTAVRRADRLAFVLEARRLRRRRADASGGAPLGRRGPRSCRVRRRAAHGRRRARRRMRNVRLVIEYDGGRFSGWQSQARPGVRTVQEELEAVLSRVLRERVLLTVAGRTDTGVHAEGQVANFLTASDVPLSRLARALAGLLPADIAVRGLAVVPPSFHARHRQCSGAMPTGCSMRRRRRGPGGRGGRGRASIRRR